MKKFLMLLCAVTLVFGMAGGASALLFTLDSYDVSLNDSDPGLVVFWEPILSPSASCELDVGESITFGLFKLGSLEEWTNYDDRDEKDIGINFYFSTPTAEMTGTGEGVTAGRGFSFLSFATVDWDNPIEFSFGSTGLISITLEDDWFWLAGDTTINATLTYLRADAGGPTAVPEPATILLMGIGLLGVVGYSRKRLNKKH